jgi:hypothetical protein
VTKVLFEHLIYYVAKSSQPATKFQRRSGRDVPAPCAAKAMATDRRGAPRSGDRYPLHKVALALVRVSQALGWCAVCMLEGLVIDIGHHGQTLAAH